ncbi:MAG TPA: DNA/RNA helicase domain-containing protein [Candidatus Dormibacteraeota bacterium]|nr:DNA/RNA helicase domain-containing protein [Candidatus Dormibacteraeota bacterium]
MSEFTRESPAGILWKLTQENAAARFPLTPEAIESWRAQLPILTNGINHLLHSFAGARDWSILIEYPIPIVGRRIDAVLLAGNVIIVIETKTGVSPTSAARQVEDYALSLACFHEHSSHRTIVPVVVADAPTAVNTTGTAFDNLIEKCWFSSTANLGSVLESICRQYVRESELQIDADDWNRGRFRPIPPIIDAAVALYSDMDVFEIGHACAAREDLEKTTNALVMAVLEAQTRCQKVICFTTGVPGAGKTLVGLNTVHRPEIKNFASFLSGNGPLVKVIQEALVRDTVKRSHAHSQPMNRRQAQLEVQAFVHNVHRFADQYYGEGKQQPVPKVVVFDEAQRAWDDAENARAGRPRVSEPEMMLEVMDRHPDWAAIIALIGGGQEINRGEAGLAEWGRALARFPHWQVHAPPLVLTRAGGASGFRLFETAEDPYPRRIVESAMLHLNICTRSIRAQRISEWVDAVLSGGHVEAVRIAQGLDVKPVIARSLNATKAWLNANRRGRTRSGLVASASAIRLRADGLEPTFDFQQRFDWEHWFLDVHDCTDPDCDHKYCNDVRASSILEVAATQFKIQGLELDWIGLCWGEDLTWDGSKWVARRFNNKHWKLIKPTDTRRRMYLVNAYRVLMTRARLGMVIYVPQPEAGDASRLAFELDSTAEFLIRCGAVPLLS